MDDRNNESLRIWETCGYVYKCPNQRIVNVHVNNKATFMHIARPSFIIGLYFEFGKSREFMPEANAQSVLH